MIAVTGAGGFIGSALVWHLNQLGERDILCVETHTGDTPFPNLTPLAHRGLMGHDAFLAQLESGAWNGELRCVFHLGACSNTTETDEAYLRRNNFDYSRRLCLAALACNARFVHAGSAATYGDGSAGYSDEHRTLDRLKPLNPYGWSKHHFDLWARDEGLLEQIAVLKYFNVYGPNEWHKGAMRSMVCKGYEQIRDTGVVRLFRSDRPEVPDGGQQRDFVYVKDAVAITQWFQVHPRANGIFNVGTGEANTWNRLMNAIFAALDRPSRIEYIDMPAELLGKYQGFTQADIAKLRAAGWTNPFTPLEDAVRDYVRHHLMTHAQLGATPP